MSGYHDDHDHDFHDDNNDDDKDNDLASGSDIGREEFTGENERQGLHSKLLIIRMIKMKRRMKRMMKTMLKRLINRMMNLYRED